MFTMKELKEFDEISYIDILSTLHDMVKCDNIPQNEKNDILERLYILESKLEKYSY